MGNTVVIIGPTGTLSIQSIPVPPSPDLEFRSGSFRASADERRVMGVFMVIPTGGKEFELRFEFTDSVFAENNLKGEPMNLDPSQVIEPYKEPKQTRNPKEGR